LEKEQARLLADFMENSASAVYEIQKLETSGGRLLKFHQWTNGKPTLAAFEITRPDSDTGYYFVFIDWHQNDNYYLVVYAHDRSTTCAEIRQIQEIDGAPHLIWTYKPFKRDGKNDQRKAYFKQMFGSTTIQIKLPYSAIEVEKFLGQVFKLCQNRLMADRIVERFKLE